MQANLLATPEAPLVLVVDDDLLMRRMLSYALAREGYRIEEAENGQEAVAAFTQLSPDVMLMDAVMPKLNGFDACRQIRALPGGKSIPILIVTSLDDDDSVSQAFEAGASDFITKPIHWAVLRQRTRRMLEASHAERRVQRLAYHDTLTGLPNRVLLAERLGQSLAQARRTPHRLALLFADLDRFKWINDTLGHDAGDRLIKSVATCLNGCLRESDTVARLGGDEFVLLLDPVQHSEDAALVAAKVLEVLRGPFLVGGREITIAASIGIAVYPDDGDNLVQLMKHADTAMYHAKENGRDQYVFYRLEMTQQVSRRLELENSLRQALENDEFQLHYQPQVDLASGQVMAMEALLRWRHPQHGLIPPGDFIPLAEETGLIVPIGDWVLKTAWEQLQDWQASGLPPLHMAVNLSARQFRQPDLVSQVQRLIACYPERPWLELEITESLLMDDADKTTETLRALKTLGVTIAIDDFGTGYSSLSYLNRFPIDRLKIDKSFVRDVTHDPDSAAIAQAIAALGQSLKLRVLAEGVESEAQLEFLRSNGVEEIQGYFFSRPLPADEATLLLKEGRSLTTARPETHQQRTLLLVDDETRLTAGLRRGLRGQNYRILTAGSAWEAFDLLARYPVGVVISDQLMPGMQGNEFLRRVRELYPDTTRIILSGHSDMNTLVDAINEGAIFKFLTKPVDEQRLRAVLREAFAVHEAQTPRLGL